MRRLRLFLALVFLVIVAGAAYALRDFVALAPEPTATPTRQPMATAVPQVIVVPVEPRTATSVAQPTKAPPSPTPAEPTATPTERTLVIILATPTALPTRQTATPPSPTPTRRPATPTPTKGTDLAAQPVLPVLVERIAWAQARGQGKDIWVMSGDGSDATRLTSTDTHERQPAWSPDGRLLAFVSNRDGNNEIYVMSADGSNQTRLTDNPANDYAPAWSPDGRMIAFVSNRDGNDEIYVMRSDGSGQVRLTDNGAFDGQPAWSPDGSLIAFTSSRDRDLNIYVMPAGGGTATRLTSDKAEDRDPAWAPNGSALAFVSNRSGQFQIYTMKPNGSDQRRLTNVARGAEHPSWGPQVPGLVGLGGHMLVYVAYEGTAPAAAAGEIYVMRGDGSEQHRLTQNEVEDTDPAWHVPLQPVALAPTPRPQPPTPTPMPTSPTAPRPSPTPLPPAPIVSAEIIIDDLSPQFTRGGTASYWKESRIGFGNHMYYTYNAPTLDNWARWTPRLPQAGKYEVFVFIPSQNATTKRANYVIVHAGKRDRQVINQLLYENAWLSLGVYEFNAQGNEYVELGDVTGEPKTTKRIGFDAVKFVYRGP